ncbi:MAG: Holliday junction resolvase RuvX [Phycisphaerae bacterium]|nr:Holliday junction resolvase RuvX [Tepidisphaeraceae bacterium]
MRTLAIDLGTRRVGLALSDEGGRFATPLDVLQVASPAHAREQILKVIGREGPERLVVGVPINMDGTVGPAVRGAVAFGRELEAACGKPVLYVDERLSSFEAEQTLAGRRKAGENLTRQRKKERLDAVAAASFLQGFLDGKLPAIEPAQLGV